DWCASKSPCSKGTPRWCCPITCETKVASMAYDQLVDIKDLIAEIEDHLTEDNFADVAGRVNTLKPARVIKIFERLGHRRRAIVYRLLDKNLALKVFVGLSPVLQSDLMDALQECVAVDVYVNMAPDDRVCRLYEQQASVASMLMRRLETGELNESGVLMGNPEDSNGRRMCPRFITLRPWHTVAEAMERVHERLEEAETIYYLPVIDTGRRVVGAVSLRQLISGEDSQRVEEFMEHYGTAEEYE